jgi:hypothetical protein
LKKKTQANLTNSHLRKPNKKKTKKSQSSRANNLMLNDEIGRKKINFIKQNIEEEKF